MTNLSPAAQAVLDAYGAERDEADPLGRWVEPAIAAALRAAATQLFPEEHPPYEALMEWIEKHPDDLPPWQIRAGRRKELFAIAAELECVLGPGIANVARVGGVRKERNRPPLWRVMKKAWETTTPATEWQRWAAEIRAVRDWLQGELPEGGAWYALLTAEAKRAEKGE